jgi:hypothetical protein
VRSVLRWYYELEDGTLGYKDAALFDVQFLNYRVDVWHLLDAFSPAEQLLLQLIHRDGVPQAQAVRLAGFTTSRPDTLVAALETRLGRRFVRADIDDLARYMLARARPSACCCRQVAVVIH